MQLDGLTIDESVIEGAQAEAGHRMSFFGELDVVEADVLEDTVSRHDTVVCPGCDCWGGARQFEIDVPELPDRETQYCAYCHSIVVAPEGTELPESRSFFMRMNAP